MPADLTCPAASEPVDGLLPELIAELLDGGTRVRLDVGGVSMAPRLRNNDCVLIEPLKGTDARFGDLVLFRNSTGALILHRLLRRWRDCRGQLRLQTRGDANVRLDTSIDCARVLGRARQIERSGKSTIDLENVGERIRAVIIGACKLLCSAAYYKLAPTGNWTTKR